MNIPTPAARGNHSARAISLIILISPAAILGLLALRYSSLVLTLGAASALLGASLFFRSPFVWRPPVSSSTILLYFMALGWCWFCTRELSDAAASFARGLLLLVPLVLMISHELIRTGAEARRRARGFCTQLRSRRRWPSDLAMMRRLPEVIGLRENLRYDASPVFQLFDDPSSEVRMAAFLSLSGRNHWRPAELAVVIRHARQSNDPAVRVMAISAMESSQSIAIVSEIAQFLNDPEPEVRSAAARIALGNGERWSHLRESIRAYLANPQFTADRGIPGSEGRLPAIAICDLTAWAAEFEPLSKRSVRTLVEHYAELLRNGTNYDLVTDLSVQILNSQTPTALRIELAHLLRTFELLTPNVLDRMTNSDQPSSIRLLATEVLLKSNPSDPDALDVLRGLGRQPNREIALTVAKVLQQHLGFDMGLPEDRRAVTGKLAGDVVKRVQHWANSRSVGNAVIPTPGSSQPGLCLETPPPENRGAPPRRRAVPKRGW